MLRIFRDLFDHRVARHVKYDKMISNVSTLKWTYVISIIFYLLLVIIVAFALYMKPSWGHAGFAALVLIIARAICNSKIQFARREVDEDAEQLAFYYSLEKLFLEIWTTRRINTVSSSQKLLEELEKSLRTSIRHILTLQGDTKALNKQKNEETIAKLHPLVKNLVALIVRFELMGSGFINVENSGEMSNEDFFNARAHYLYTQLFLNPDFRMP
jgi:hypothetical protein